MATAIKSGTTAIAGAIVKGNFSYFSGSTQDLGPTSSTGIYSGIDAPASGYTVYQVGGLDGWTARVATNDSSLNSILIDIGASGSTLQQRITWATNTNSVFIATPVTVGQSAFGGIVGYILQPGDPGYESTQQHGLIIASANTATSTRWALTNSGLIGATGSTIGTGMRNTNLIVASQGASALTYAAGKCRAVTDGGYTDWYLPSRNESEAICNAYVGGGFGSLGILWSSTENSSGVGAYVIDNGICAGNAGWSKTNAQNIRAVRSF